MPESVTSWQMNEQVRHRAVQALEGEPGKVARAGADTTQRHLGHALGGKAGNEAVAQVAHAVDVDVAHRVVVTPGAQRGPRLMEGPLRCARRLRARGHGGACGAAEHSGLGGFPPGGLEQVHFSMFLLVFFAVSLCTKNGEGHRGFFWSFLWRCPSTSKAVPLCTKNCEEGHRAFFVIFVAVPLNFKSGATLRQGQQGRGRAGRPVRQQHE